VGKHIKYILIVNFCAAMLLIGVGGVIAQSQEFTGYMGDDVPNNEYDFDLQEGDTLTAVSIATSGNLDPVLWLEDDAGNRLMENDDRGDGTLNSEITFTAEVSGTYTLTMSNIRETSGDYTLTVDITGSGGQTSTQTQQSQTAPVGDATEYTGFMSYEVPDDQYPVDLVAGQTLIVSAEATSGDLDPVVGVEDENGDVVAQNDDREQDDLNSYVEYTAPADGTYTVIMSNYGKTGGDYLLTITILAPGEAAPSGNTSTNTTAPPTTAEADEVYTGYVDDATPQTYEITLEAGQGVVVKADATDVNLDTLVTLLDENGDEVALNDDRSSDDLNSTLVYVAQTTGTYTIVMGNYRGTQGNYQLTVQYVSNDEALALLDAGREQLSGPILIYDTENFRIHYTTEGTDATTEDFARQVGETMEEVRAIQIDQLGWASPMTDGIVGGDTRFDIYLIELLDNPDRGELGSASPEFPIGDNPATSEVETGASASYMTMDDDYAETSEGGNAISLMRATAAHEHHHAVQFGYEANEPHFWYYEATASWMETITFPDEQDATGYVSEVFNYPEICFGVQGEADPAGGLLKYGSWLFIQAMQDWYGPEAPILLWQNIANTDGWEPLAQTLAAYGDTIPDALARYHAKNLMRDYGLTSEFSEFQVWQENVIEDAGDWTVSGQGIQELGANYFEVALSDGVYTASLSGDEGGNLQLFAIGINGTKGDVIPLGRAGAFNASAYENVYLMVFNPDYDDDVSECAYLNYSINVQPSSSLPNAVDYSLDASQFTPLR